MGLSEVSQFAFLTILEVSLQYGNFLPFLPIELVLLPLIEKLQDIQKPGFGIGNRNLGPISVIIGIGAETFLF